MVEQKATSGCNSEKCCQIRNWIRAFLKTPSDIFVGEYVYDTAGGSSKIKSVICILGLFPEKGIICIDKPIDEVQPTDVLMFYKSLR